MVSSDKKQIHRDYRRYLIPTVVSMIAHSIYCLADVFFVAWGVGSDGLAALNIALPIFTFYSCFSLMVGVGTATTISVCKGVGDDYSANQTLTMAYLLLLSVGAVAAVVGSIWLDNIAQMLGAPEELVPLVHDYLVVINATAFMYILSSASAVIIRCDENPKLVMVATTIGNITNIVLDFVFVILCKWSVFGAGLATAIGPCVTVAILSVHFLKKQNTVRFVKKFFHFSLFGRIFKNGIGTSIMEVSSGIVILFINKALLKVSGPDSVAIFSIISNIAYVGKGVFNGIAQAAQPIISRSYGSKNYRAIHIVNRHALLITAVFSLGIYGVICLFPSTIITTFVSHEPAIVVAGTTAILLYFLSFPFTGLNTVIMYYFQSMERPRSTMMISILRGVALVYLFLQILPVFWGENGVWLSLFGAEFITFGIFFPLHLRFGKKQQKAAEESYSQTLLEPS